MTDINSKIDAAKEQIESYQSQIAEVQKSKRDKTLAGFASQAPPVRGPPAVKVRRTLKGHFGKVTAMHWANEPHILVSASQDGNLLVWNALSSHKLESIHLKSNYVMSVGIEQSKGNLVACGGLDNLCTVYSRSNPEKAVELASHDGFLSCCRFLSEQEILTSSGDSRIIRFDIETQTPVSTFAEHSADALFLALKDKNVFASCSVDLTTKIWDIRTPDNSVQTYKGHNGDINAVEFMQSCSDPNCFATCSQDNTVRVYDMRSYNELAVFGTATDPAAEAIPSEGYTSLAFSKSGRVIFVGHADGNVVAYDLLGSNSTAPAYTLMQAHERHVSCVGVSKDGDALCSGSWDGLLKIWA